MGGRQDDIGTPTKCLSLYEVVGKKKLWHYSFQGGKWITRDQPSSSWLKVPRSSPLVLTSRKLQIQGSRGVRKRESSNTCLQTLYLQVWSSTSRTMCYIVRSVGSWVLPCSRLLRSIVKFIPSHCCFRVVASHLLRAGRKSESKALSRINSECSPATWTGIIYDVLLYQGILALRRLLCSPWTSFSPSHWLLGGGVAPAAREWSHFIHKQEAEKGRTQSRTWLKTLKFHPQWHTSSSKAVPCRGSITFPNSTTI